MLSTFVVLALVVCITPVVMANGQGENSSDGVVNLKLSHSAAETHRYHKAALKFKEEIEKRTNGRYTITIFPLNQLGTQEEVTEAVQLGTIDIAITSDDKLMTLVPDFSVLGMPFLFRDYDHAYSTLNGEVGDLLSKKLEEKNVMVISWLENGFRQITNNRQPIFSPEDLNGLKIRVSTSKANMLFFNTCGAASTNITTSELYTALQLNTVEAQENPLANIIDKKLYEVQKYLSISGHVHTAEPMIMSKSTFDSLSPEDKKIFLEVGREVSQWAFDDAKNSFDENIEALKIKGMEVNYIDPSRFNDVVDAVYNEYGKQYSDLINKIKANK
jgi:tripartite ATP-independent transporter DctP family solute receptor